MKTVTGKLIAYLTPTAMAEKRSSESVDSMIFSTLDMTDHGWVRVGDAEITVSLDDSSAIVRSQVSMLKEAKRRVLAEMQAKSNLIDGQIQSLLAIECK